ncbi:MAG: hypothetical protein RLZ98_3000 [Pseudomonadota bacterium]
MELIGKFLYELGGWNWFILAVVMLILEAIVPGVHFIWFGISALIVGALALGLADYLSWQWQLGIFGALSFASIWMMRQYWRPESVESDEPNLNVRGSQYIGQLVVVENAISGGRGRVRVGDTVWSARGPDVEAGVRVKVVGVDGTVLVVEPT